MKKSYKSKKDECYFRIGKALIKIEFNKFLEKLTANAQITRKINKIYIIILVILFILPNFI